jgi:LPS export ABC transporter permease LptG
VKSPPVGILDRYLARELLGPFGFGVILFTFFLLIDRLYQLTELVITKGVPFHLVIQLLVYMLPNFLSQTLPMALLVAVLLAGGRLAGDLEVVAFKAAGVSLLRLFRPVLLVALGVTLVAGAMTLVLTPLSSREFQRQLVTILQTRAVSGLKERVFNTSFGDLVIYVEEISASQVALRGVVVSVEKDPAVSRIITAREGRLLTDDATNRITLRLIDGAVNEADVLPADPRPRPANADPPGGAASARRYRYTKFSVYDMNLAVESSLRISDRAADKPEKDLALGDLRARIATLAGNPDAYTAHVVELHKRFAIPLVALVFALLGFPLAVRSHRGGRSIAFIATLVILVFYYLIFTTLEGLALRRRLPPALAIWLPNLVFGGVGLGLLAVTVREWRAPRLTGAWRIADSLWQQLPRRRARRHERFLEPVGDSTHIIDRYLLRQFAVFTGIGLGVAAALYVVVDLLQTLDRYLRVKPPVGYILEHFLYRLPEILHEALPIVLLVATIFLFLSLNRNHELTALKAAGVSLYRVAMPVLLAGLGAAVVSAVFQETLLPMLNERGEEVDRVKIRGQLPKHLQIRSRIWLRSSENRFYRVELLDPGTHDLYGVSVLDLDRDFRVASRLDARHAHWTPRGWEFADGAIREISRDGRLTTIPFGHTTLALEDGIDDFVQSQKPLTAMGYRELRDYVARLEAAGLQAPKYLVDLYSKLSSPLKNLIMVLVAIPFALQSPRGGRLFGVGLAIVIMAGYMVVHYIALAFARADLLPPLLAAWTANIIFLGLGASLFLRART